MYVKNVHGLNKADESKQTGEECRLSNSYLNLFGRSWDIYVKYNNKQTMLFVAYKPIFMANIKGGGQFFKKT
jgi:hypothetical protein